jgi:hypothetical protein
MGTIGPSRLSHSLRQRSMAAVGDTTVEPSSRSSAGSPMFRSLPAQDLIELRLETSRPMTGSRQPGCGLIWVVDYRAPFQLGNAESSQAVGPQPGQESCTGS